MYLTRTADHGTPMAAPRKGAVLLAVLVVLVVLTLAAYEYGELMAAEYKAAASYTRSAQATVLADSGVNYAAALLSNPDALNNVLNGNPFDNPERFHGVLVADNPQPGLRGRFSILAPVHADDPDAGGQPYRFGAADEAAKINLNALLRLDSSGRVAHDVLIELPNMTEDLVNAILDWIDPDSEPRTGGGENEFYAGQTPSYRCKNGPLDSLEELLLVKGMTPGLLYGNDRNRNGVLDPDEDGGDGLADQGLSAYLTVYSRERNTDAQGQPRVYVNDNNLELLYTNLANAVGPDLAAYIVAYRIYGGSSSSSSGGRSSSSSQGGGGGSTSSRGGGSGGGSAGGGSSGGGRGGTLSRNTINFRGGRPRSISSLYELINTQVSIPGPTQGSPATVYPSPLNSQGRLRELLPLLLDRLTTSRDPDLPARVNINTAPEAVLAALPGLSDADIQTILSRRPSLSSHAPDPIYQTPAWLITEANLRPETVRTLERYVTTRSQVYRVQVLGYFDGGGPTARVEAVIDTNAGRPRVVYWRNLTELGRGFHLEQGR